MSVEGVISPRTSDLLFWGVSPNSGNEATLQEDGSSCGIGCRQLCFKVAGVPVGSVFTFLVAWSEQTD